MLPNTDTFCAAPWFSIRNENKGDYQVCCEHAPQDSEFTGRYLYNSNDSLNSWINSDYMHYLREQLNTGVRVPECNKCWTREDVGLTSLRNNMNKLVTNQRQLEKSWVPIYFKNKINYSADRLIVADVKIDNLCNFSCAMCNAADSSVIYSIWNNQKTNEFVMDYVDNRPDYFSNIKSAYMEKNGLQILDEVLTHPVQVLKILGGEPLLNPRLLTRLMEIPSQHRQQINLIFITNGSIDLTEIGNKLTGFRNIFYTVSLESIGDVQDYVRRGSNWSIIQKNIDNFIKNKETLPGLQEIGIHTTVQALNITHFKQLREWCKSRDLKHTFTVISSPDYLGLSVVPEHIKSIVLGEFDKMKDDNEIQSLISLFEKTTYNNVLAEKFKRFIKWYDPKLELTTVLPVWKDHFETTSNL